jgi:hypothetical protein
VTWTLKLSQFNNDLSIKRGKFRTVTGADEVVQRVVISLRHLKGEYFLNTPAGVPWDDEIMGAKYSGETINSIFRRTILGVPGVDRIEQFNVLFNSASREYDLDVVISTDGQSQPINTSI